MVSSEISSDGVIGLSEQQRALLRAFTEPGTADTIALHRAYVGEDRRLTRSEQASFSRALRRLEQRGLLMRTPEGVELTVAGLDLVFPTRHNQALAEQARLDLDQREQAARERQAHLDQLRADIDRLGRIIKSGAFWYERF